MREIVDGTRRGSRGGRSHSDNTTAGVALVLAPIQTIVSLRIARSGYRQLGNRRGARLRGYAKALWRNQRIISSVEHAMLLAFIAVGNIAAADLLSNAVTNEFSDTAALLDGAGDGGGNDGGGNGSGGDGGSGQGGGNTC